MQIKFDIQTDHLDRIMSELSLSIAEPHLLLGSMGESLLNENQDRHAKGVAPDGTPWKPLSQSTLQTKRSKRILYENGDMLRFQYQVGKASSSEQTTGKPSFTTLEQIPPLLIAQSKY